jgi:hypothetical protein
MKRKEIGKGKMDKIVGRMQMGEVRRGRKVAEEGRRNGQARVVSRMHNPC